MDQRRNTGHASHHEHQGSEGAILCALVLGMHRHEDGGRPENPDLPTEGNRVLEQVRDTISERNCAYEC